MPAYESFQRQTLENLFLLKIVLSQQKSNKSYFTEK